jgi:HSP20 family protein
MSLVRWNPWRELEDIQGRLNQLFGETGLPRERGDGSTLAEWSPAVDVQETDNEYLVKADLPDVKKEAVKVQLVDGSLSIEGERRREKEENGKRFHKVEREYGSFVRRFTLPSEVDATKVHAEFKNGVLNVHLPKSESAKAKAVDVKVS